MDFMYCWHDQNQASDQLSISAQQVLLLLLHPRGVLATNMSCVLLAVQGPSSTTHSF
jgi:hypothetical protein